MTKTYTARTVVWLVATVAIAALFVGHTVAQVRTPVRTLPIVTTSDAKASYTPLGLISARSGGSGENIFKDLEEKLAREAAKLEATAVVEVRFIAHQGYLHAYGTAVKIP